jgi:dihydroorotate dehydrogenase
MFQLIRRILFLMPAETAHYFTLNTLQFLLKIPIVSSVIKKILAFRNGVSFQIAGIQFPNRVGLAAGFDKNAKYLSVMQTLGFGHVEIGTVTPKPQSGNDKPRLFRLIKDQAIINRMGFNNDGVDAIVERLKKRPKNLIVGGNIGKNKITANEDAIRDYLICFNKLYPYVDYFTVNVSSPNTPGLRELQDKGPLTELMNALISERELLIQKHGKKLPVFLKIAPDLTEDQLNDIVELSLETKIDGIVSSNTTISREGLKTDKNTVDTIGAGGLSGKPLKNKSNEVLAYLCKQLDGRLPVIAVGGIFDAADAQEKLVLGAKMVQIYSGFIYEGPALVKNIAKMK